MAYVEELLRQAIAAGKFEQLPGKGQPLKLEEHPFVDPDWRLAYHLLKSSGFTLPWLELRQEIEAQIVTARQMLQQAWEWRQDALHSGLQPGSVEQEWGRACARFSAQVEKINRQIFDYNLKAPLERFQLRRLDLATEIQAVQEALPPRLD